MPIFIPSLIQLIWVRYIKSNNEMFMHNENEWAHSQLFDYSHYLLNLLCFVLKL